jgi:hypothetical protein
MYDAYVRGALAEDIARAANATLAKVHAEIKRMRESMRRRYPGTTDVEADELRAIYLLSADARKMADPSSMRIASELQLRHRDIVSTVAARQQSLAARAADVYQ